MGFVLKIYFLGLVTFLPSSDGSEMTVLLLDAREPYILSDESELEPHQPFLLARAGACRQDCRQDFQAVADFIFGDAPEPDAEALRAALVRGGAWRLHQSEIIIPEARRKKRRQESGIEIYGRGRESESGAGRAPATIKDPRHFDWVTDLGTFLSSTRQVHPDVVSKHPKENLVVARMKLSRGSISTAGLVSLKNEVIQAKFQPLSGAARGTPPTRAMADLVVAEVPVSKCKLKILERGFDGRRGRIQVLRPKKCNGKEVIELAVLNLPQSSFQPPPKDQAAPTVGKHFEIYYELAHPLPPVHRRLVPFVDEGLSDLTAAVRGSRIEGSRLLDGLQLGARGGHSRSLCPVSQFTPGLAPRNPEPRNPDSGRKAR